MSFGGDYAPLTEDRYLTGLETQRGKLQQGADGRIDTLCDGLNTEISSSLTLIRRPGHSVYNSQQFPAVLRFHEFHVVVDGVASVRILADTAAGVYDATGPNTKTLLWQKAPGTPGKTCFQSVGNTLYFSTGPDQKKWLISNKAWAAAKTFNAGDWIVDGNNNIQLLLPQKQQNIASVSITSGVVTVVFAGPSPFSAGSNVALAGLTGAVFLNGVTLTVLPSTSVNGFQANFAHADYPKTADTGTVTFGVGQGVTGNAQPNWSSTIGAFTPDGSLLWKCWGSAVQNWGIVAPTVAPGVSQVTAPNQYDPWQANTYYSTSLAIVDENGNVQQLTKSGVTGGSEPSWNATLGGITNDGSAQWVNNGTAAWQASGSYSVGDVIEVTYTYYVQQYVPNPQQSYQNYPNSYEQNQQGGSYQQVPVTVTEAFACLAEGNAAAYQPDWSAAPGLGSTLVDGTVSWENLGAVPMWSAIGANTNVSTDTQIVDSNGYIQKLQSPGKTGANAPSWNVTPGATTPETSGTASWINAGASTAKNTGTWNWGFAYKCSIDKTVSSISPASVSLVVGQNRMAVLQGSTSPDPQVDTIVMFRTLQDGGIQFQEDEFPMPAGGTWTYQDSNPDPNLALTLKAPLNGVNNPPPTGIVALEYHCGRMWAAVGNLVYFCTGPDISIGNGNTQWYASNVFGYPDSIARLVAINIDNGALLVFTASGVKSVMGLGTPTSQFYPSTYAERIGLLNGDALDVIGATIHLFTTARKLVALDPSAGYTETGFPIGDQFKTVTTGGINAALYSAANTTVTWHEAESGDTGLFVADGAVGWFQYSPVSGSTKAGFLWSPRAAVEGGTSAVKSCEIQPGARALLVGPKALGPILMRDRTVHSDNAVSYSNTYATIGNLQVAFPGEVAEVAFVTLDSVAVGTPPTVGLLLGELAPTEEVPFTMLERTSQDPPLLPRSVTAFNDRFHTMQNGEPPLCRHLQLLFQWSSEDAASELLQHAVYGMKYAER